MPWQDILDVLAVLELEAEELEKQTKATPGKQVTTTKLI